MTTKDSKLLFFTESYPFSSAAEDTFIEPELRYLDSFFESIIIIPRSLEGKAGVLPQNVKLEVQLGHLIKSMELLKSRIQIAIFVVSTSDFYKEIIKKPNKSLHISSVLRIINYIGVALRTKRWVYGYIEDNNIDLTKTIFYTYWLNEITMGIWLAKKKYPNLKIVSRAHGIDLYEERSCLSYIPFRPEIFTNINKIFPDSDEGKQYLSSRYPAFSAAFTTSRLGVPVQEVFTNSSNDDVFRIVSCSYLVTVKRIGLLIRGLEELGKIHKKQAFEWTHIGDGPLRTELEQISRTKLPHNVKYAFLGFVPDGGVISFYRDNPVDIFINVSSSEGTPVSIMEAQSCGIPVIATAVGGNKEIVNDDVGVLISPDPSPDEIANAICKFVDNPESAMTKRKNSILNWEMNYNSEKNFSQFGKQLLDLLKTN